MTCKHVYTCWAGLLALCAALARADDFALVGGTIHTGSGDVIADGTLIVRAGKVAAIGPRASTIIPEGLNVVSAEGKHVTPGLIDLHSRLLIAEGELRDQGGAESRSVMDAFDPFDATWQRALAEGITTVAIAPGTSQGAGGLGAVVKLGPGGAQVIARESHFVAALGVSGDRSTSAERLEQYYRLRGLFLAAKEYEKTWDAHWKAVEKYNDETRKRAEAEKKAGAEAKPEKSDKAEEKPGAPPAQAAPAPAKPPDPPKAPRPPAVDVGREALLRALAGKIPVLVEAHRRDDLEYALLLKKELVLKIVLLGATQGLPLADAIAKADVPVAVEPVLLDRWALEYRGHSESNAALLAAAKVPVAIASSGAGGLASRRLRWQAVAAVRGGLSREDALRAVTSAPAKILGLESRLGALEPGKDADFVVFSGDPLDARSRVELVSVEGALAMGAGRKDAAAHSQPIAAESASVPPRNPSPESKAVAAAPGGKTVVFQNARIVTPQGAGVRTIEKGTVVMRGGKIEAVGAAGEVKTPEAGADVIDLEGKWLLPGFIDALSHAGLGGETDDTALAINEDLRVIDAFDPWDLELPRLLSRGITCVALSPGSVNVVGGKVSLVKIVPGRPKIRIVDAAAGLKASLAPAMSLPRYPTSLSGAVHGFEEWVRGGGPKKSGVKGPVIVDVPSRAAAERAIAALGNAGVPAALVDGGRLSADAWGLLHPRCTVILGPYGLGDPASRLRAAAVLRAAGAPIAFAMGGTRRDLLTSAALAMEQGLSRDDALLALTAWPAALYGAEARLGAIASGADADLAVWSGDPFSLTGRVEMVFVDGERMEIGEEKTEREPSPAPKEKDVQRAVPDKAFSGGNDA